MGVKLAHAFAFAGEDLAMVMLAQNRRDVFHSKTLVGPFLVHVIAVNGLMFVPPAERCCTDLLGQEKRPIAVDS